jgi:hypothetical protein
LETEEPREPVAMVTGIYRGKAGGLELLTPGKPLNMEEVRRNPVSMSWISIRRGQ